MDDQVAHDSGAPAQMATLLDALWIQTVELYDAVSGRLLDVPSGAKGWTRQNVLHHLEHAADASVRLTRSAILGRQDTWYPGGPAERESSIAAHPDVRATELVDAGVRSARALQDTWRTIDRASFIRSIDEPRLGRLSINDLVALRATEILMHGLDLQVGLRAERWPAPLVGPLVPWRLDWMRRGAQPPVAAANERFWIEATDTGQVWLLSVHDGRIEVEPRATVGQDDRPHLRLTHRALLQVLVGRVPVHVADEAVTAFIEAVPGP